jgi:twinkle protein
MNQDWEKHGIDLPHGASGEVRTTCPECSPDRAKKRERCLAVNVDKGTWVCHHCGWTGGLATDNDGYGSIPRPAPRPAPVRPAYQPANSADAASLKARAWLERERGIPVAVSDAARIEARKVWMPDGAKGGDEWAIAFPYFRDGRVVNVKYRTPDKRFRMEKGAELCLYGLDTIAGETLVWMEGEIDALSVIASGVPSVVSVPNGAPPPDARHYDRLLAYLDADAARLAGVSRHVIATDADAPGRKLRDELVRRLGPERCALVEWPAGCKDANDVLRQYDTTTLRQHIDAARPVPIAGLITVDDIAERLDRLYDEGLRAGEHPGSDALARNYTVKPGQWTVVTGVPGHGKSALIDWMLVGLAERAGWRLAVCSPENQPLERHAAHLAELRARRPFGAGPRQRMSREELAETRAWLRERFYFILPPDDEFTIDGVLDRARAAVLRYGVRGLVIDPWNEIEHSRPAAMTETEYISQALTKIRNFARRHEIHIWLVAHPTKLVKDSHGAYPVPTLYDVSGSAHWRNKADMGLVVWRDPLDPDGPTQVYVQKVRFRECGEVGMVSLYYDRATGRYSDFGPIAYRDDTPPLDPWDADSESA